MDYDDHVEDTPLIGKSNNNCYTDDLSCKSEIILKHNYMDYVPDQCMNMFTQRQANRMKYVLVNSLDRKSLTVSNVTNRK